MPPCLGSLHALCWHWEPLLLVWRAPSVFLVPAGGVYLCSRGGAGTFPFLVIDVGVLPLLRQQIQRASPLLTLKNLFCVLFCREKRPGRGESHYNPPMSQAVETLWLAPSEEGKERVCECNCCFKNPTLRWRIVSSREFYMRARVYFRVSLFVVYVNSLSPGFRWGAFTPWCTSSCFVRIGF